MHSLNESILNSFKEAFLLEDYKSAKSKLIEKGASEDEADSLISRHKELKKLNRLDSSIKDIDLLVKNFSPEEIKQKLFNISTQTKSEIKKRIEGKIVAENDEYLVYKIDTPEESYRFHGLTKWCICSGTESEARKHFNYYSKDLKNIFYFFVRKNIKDPKDEWNYIALQRRNKLDDVYWSMTDKGYKLSDVPVNLPEFDKPPLEPLSVEEKFIRDGFKKNTNGEFDIDGNFKLKHGKYEYLIVGGKFGVKFGKVRGYFDCSYCENLTSLEGCPREVGGNFNCSYCKNLTSLEGSPREVGGNFDCTYCVKLTSLEGCPEKVGKDFYCGNCENLKSLKGLPEKVGGWLSCYNCENLTNLEGCPKEVNSVYCYKCKNLTSLEGCPRQVDGEFDCSECENLTSLEGCPRQVGMGFHCYDCGIKFTEDDVKSLCNVGGKIVC